MLLCCGQAVATTEEEANSLQVSQLLTQTVSENSAVEIALMNNRSIQAMLLEVGISQADVLQAGLLPNPGYSLGIFKQGDELSMEHGFHFNLDKLLFRNELQGMAQQKLLQTQQRLVTQLIQLGHESRKAHIEAVADQETTLYMQQVWSLAKAGADLADKMKAAGNFNKLQQAREQEFEAQARSGLLRAQRSELSSREKLGRLMGLNAGQMHFKLPHHLPPLPLVLKDSPALEDQALQQGVDVQRAKLNNEQIAPQSGFTKASHFINVLEVREAYANYKVAYEMALHHRDVVLPLQQTIAEENLLRYNGMLMGVFELLSESRQQITSVTTYMTLQKEFWLAQIDLDMAMIGKPSLSISIETPASATVSPAH